MVTKRDRRSAHRDTARTTGEAATPSVKNASTESGAPAQEASTEDEVTKDAAVSKPKDDYGSFPKSNRRARRQFSEEDDKNLLQGFERHGTVWRAMRDDFELGFGMRHPTDLRDRFRIRYPKEFAKAGFKLKPKEARELKEAEEAKVQRAQQSRPPSPTASKIADANDQPVARASVAAASAAAPAPAPASASATTASKSTSLRPTFDIVTDFAFDEHEDDGSERSPIVLNRNILQWADENSTCIPATTAVPTSTQTTLTLPSSDFFYNSFAVASDGLHINPLATLKLPSTAHWSYMNPPTTNALAGPTLNPTTAAPPSLPPPAPLKQSLPASSTTNSASVSAARAQQEMRTPNLPNIVFPYVPNASARNAVHNLPAPADILSERQSGASDGFAGWIG
ncbi:hypothetical protein E8E12_011090 [Didymella heteroderae]|uniref:Myb-like domain-containing protein n=1 Tax=Didymella heteroderae TaxID=1769908 RepID=A0A9P4WYP6_9PLEO|nr:hypothetical protein E8E12_011090 [Didymella heteroderae]